MKRIAAACMLVLFGASIVCAEWLVDFRDTYVAEGIDKAVVNALKVGTTPDLIVENGLELEGLNPQNLIRALYCAKANDKDIREAAEKYNIPEGLVSAGYNKAIAECAEQIADAQAYTEGEGGGANTFPRGRSAGSGPYISAARP